MKRSAFHWSFVKSILTVSFIGLSISSTGCQFSPKPPKGLWSWKKEESKPLPDRILAVWTDSVLHQPNQPGVRGFGGRIYFYEKEETTPIESMGALPSMFLMPITTPHRIKSLSASSSLRLINCNAYEQDFARSFL